MKKIMVWTHWDLDGVVSYMVARWAFPKAQMEYQPTKVAKFRNDFNKWLLTHNIEDYDQIFILDLGIYEDSDLIDYKNVYIIDHHPGHEGVYKNAKTFVKSGYSSACKLVYKLFESTANLKLTKAQKKLVALADDYDSYSLKVPESLHLNVVFWDTNDKFEAFIKNFIGGFNGFNLKQQNIIKLHDIKVQKIKEEMEVYKGIVSIQNKDRCVCSTFASQYINEVADVLINDYDAEVILIVNTKSGNVSYRKNKNSDVELAELAKTIGDGGGHEYASGSKITDKFLLFTKLLDKI